MSNVSVDGPKWQIFWVAAISLKFNIKVVSYV